MTDKDEDAQKQEPAQEVQANEHVKAFFLALATQGKEAWNAWRRDPANADMHVNFAGVDFSDSPLDEIDFSGFEFGDGADFSGCKWRGANSRGGMYALAAFHPGRASFTGATFGELARFDGATFGNGAGFGGAIFGDRARFDGATFGDKAHFHGATFGELASFDGAIFGDRARFDGATFGDVAGFDGATFGELASFTGTTFGYVARFTGTTFGELASFGGATFGNGAGFGGAIFGDRARFDGATFGDKAHFHGATFGDKANFEGTTFGDNLSFADAVFRGRVSFDGASVDQWTRQFEKRLQEEGGKEKNNLERLKNIHEERQRSTGSGPDRFLNLRFSGAAFYGTAIFTHRSFERDADFTNTRFYKPTDVSGATNVGRVDLTGATIKFVAPTWPWWKPHWTDDPAIAVRLRAIRKVVEETKNHDLERDLYIEERKAERGAKWSRLWPQTRSAAGRLAKASLVILRPHHIARPAMLNWSDPARVVLRRIWAERARRFLSAAGQLASYSFWIIVMAAYWALADYGRSFLRPLFWLIASWAFFRWRYEDVFAPILQKLRAMGDLQAGQIPQYHDAIHMLALGHAVPFVGAFTVDSDIKKFLLCGNAEHCTLIPPPCYQGLVITQNLISILLVFFAGLALRNYFKIK